jgi:hypothetical protein
LVTISTLQLPSKFVPGEARVLVRASAGAASAPARTNPARNPESVREVMETSVALGHANMHTGRGDIKAGAVA